MTVRSRETLKKYFADGYLPTELHFRELIDSTLNMQDEGFEKTALEGLKIATAPSSNTLLTFYRAENARQGLWTVRYGGKGDPLTVQSVPLQGGGPAGAQGKADAGGGPKKPVISLHRDGRVGLGQIDPRHRLDVNGTVASRGRVGTLPVPDPEKVKADHGWHDITFDLSGCVALEVVASVGVQGSGHHAVMHALALNAHNPSYAGLVGWLAGHFPSIERRFNRRKRIKVQNAWIGDSCDQLELQWAGAGSGKPYRLQIRTRCAYDNAPRIELHVTQLWPMVAEGEASPGPAS